ncbi:hypothetical protein, partial [Bacillus altitudinis]|uniref:hypothetical protein n=1 Tax=Bacillus altitudinis TaxID=293387 RepID=UPI001C92DB5C
WDIEKICCHGKGNWDFMRGEKFRRGKEVEVIWKGIFVENLMEDGEWGENGEGWGMRELMKGRRCGTLSGMECNEMRMFWGFFDIERKVVDMLFMGKK